MSTGERDRIIGQIIDDKYRIVKLIGVGGMGAVYLAVHEGTGRLVALKVITPELMTDELVVERFKREARATGQLRHPHVVNVTDFGFACADGEKLAYLVMEHLVGQTLAELLEIEGRLPLALTVDILQQTCAAVQEAHRCGIIHRDLKPDNIWLEHRAPGGYHVKVLDFGVAKLRADVHADRAPAPTEQPVALDAPLSERCVDPQSPTLIVATPPAGTNLPQATGSLTMDVLLGTPLYMSPEQWLNRAVDARSDVYSLGIIAYRMLAGEAPFTGKSASLYMEHIRACPPSLAARAPELPMAVASVVMSALEKDAARRPPTAQTFATALAASTEGSGELVRRAVTLTVEHFPALFRVALIGYGPILAFAAVRVLNRRLVAAGALSVAVGRGIGGAAIVAHALAVIFLLPVCMGLVTLLVRDLEAAPRGAQRAPPRLAEILRCLRSSFVPTVMTTGLMLAIAVGVRAPFAWLMARVGVLFQSSTETPGMEVMMTILSEILTLFALVGVASGFAVYTSVVAMEHRSGIAALRRSAELTRPCRGVAARTLLFHFLPRSIIVPWFLLAFAAFSRLPYSEVITTSSDTLTAAVALTGLYLVNLLVAPFGMTALSLLYLKTRRLEGTSLDAIVPARVEAR